MVFDTTPTGATSFVTTKISFSPSISIFLQPVTARKARDKINNCFIVVVFKKSF
jgi:hypothetical protein